MAYAGCTLNLHLNKLKYVRCLHLFIAYKFWFGSYEIKPKPAFFSELTSGTSSSDFWDLLWFGICFGFTINWRFNFGKFEDLKVLSSVQV